MKRLLLFVLLLLPAVPTWARQVIGSPPIVNYTRQQHTGGGQTWDADTDRNGILYFANNEGLLTFNGNTWTLLPVPNHTRLRSLKVDSNGRIYVGAQDDFGYYLPDADGILRYTSLKPLIATGKKEFADIWNTVLYDGGVYFRSNNKIFCYKDATVKVYPATGEWRHLTQTGRGLFAQDTRQGLLQLKNGTWQPVCKAIAEKDLQITGIIDQESDTLLIFTLKHGIYKLHGQQLYPWKLPADTLFHHTQISCAKTWGNDQLLIGTSYGGCYILQRRTGNILQRFTIEEGLQHNSVLRIFTDRGRNIWLTLDNGIDMVRHNTAVKQVLPDNKHYLTTYAASVFNNQLFIGTSDGLFTTPLKGQTDFSFLENNFRLVNQTKGQVWSLSEAEGHLLMGHHEGAFEIKGNTASLLLKNTGCWLFRPLPRFIVAGCYNGLRIIPSDGATLSMAKPVHGLFESLRFLTTEADSIIWASHPYRGVYRISLEKDTLMHYILFTGKHGLPSDNNNSVFRIHNKTIVATQAGAYEYNPVTKTFVPSPWLTPVFHDTPLQYLKEDVDGNIWFISNKMPGVVDFHKPTLQQPYTIVYFPELKGKIVNGFECIYPYNDENILIGAEKGMYHINYRNYLQSKDKPTVLISKVKAQGNMDSLLFGGYLPPAEAAFKVMPHAYTGFHFEYASPVSAQENTQEYSFLLKGFDESWSEWTPRTEKDYTNLPYGDYTFSVRAKDNLGNISAAASYSFRILPAWYQTYLAKTVYVLILLALAWYVYRSQKKKFIVQQRKYLQQQEQLILQHKLEKEQREKQLISLQNEKLTSEVQFKNKELATSTMYLLQRSKLLFSIKEEMLLAMKKIEPSPEHSFKKVLRMFEEAENNEEDWEQFSRHFDEVHNNFLSLLKKRYPDLSTTDLKLCAYLRINLTTKEIAQSLGISVRGVETSRYRLRKKLSVPAETGLFDFLITVTDTARN